MKIAFLDAATMGDVSFEPFETLGDFVRYESSTPEQARERVKDLDVLLINKVLVDKQLIDSAPNLKLICIAATGVNNIDVEYAASKGIPVRNAVVMGHEMAHAIARHGNERMSQEAAVKLLGSVASTAIGNKKGEVAQSLFNLGFGIGSQAGILLPYSRKHEYEADKIGMYIMDIAGYDVNAAPAFWEKMLNGKSGSTNDFLSTHPSDAKRIAALKEAIKTKPDLSSTNPS